jgi:hypothetical protein
MMFHIPALFKAPFPVSEWLVIAVRAVGSCKFFRRAIKNAAQFPLAAFLTSFLTGTNRSFDQMFCQSLLMPV